MLAEPVIEAGWLGTEFILTTNVTGELFPQLLVATTESVPLVVPAVTFIEFEVEVPLQPDGKVHI